MMATSKKTANRDVPDLKCSELISSRSDAQEDGIIFLASGPEKYNELIKKQIASGRITQSDIISLAEMDENINISRILPGMRVKALQEKNMRSVAGVWNSVSNGRKIKDSDCNITRDDAKAYWILKYPDCRIVNFNTEENGELSYFREIGLDSDALRTSVANLLSVGSTWDDVLQHANFSTISAKNTVKNIEMFCGYQDRCLSDGDLILDDPFTGERLSPIDSCLLFGRSCYLYNGKHPIYLICAGAGAKALCLFVPKFNLILDFRAGISKFLSVNLFSNLFSMLTARFVKYRDIYNEAIVAKRDDLCGKEIIITAQQAANPAHHAWNFFPGFERAARLENTGNVSEVIFGGTEFYGALDVIFPEFGGIVSHNEKTSVIDPCPFSTKKLVLTVGGYFITKDLKNRLKRAAEVSGSETFSLVSEDDKVKGKFPIVWFGLRKGDKSWVSQVSGFSNLANVILKHYPSAIFVLDGFLTPVGIDEVSGQWENIKSEINDMAIEIMGNVSRPDQVINLVGASLGDGLLWADRTDLYVSPVGSTQHRIGWFSSADGIVFSAPRGNKPLNLDRLPGAWEAEGSKRPEYMIGTPVEPGFRRGAGDRRSHLENVELDFSKLTDCVLTILENRAVTTRNFEK